MRSSKDDASEDWGSFEAAEKLRRERFLARTPAQRLQWLKSALRLKYEADERRSAATEPKDRPGAD